ncbi:hypothetical protein K8T06_02580 [bacterium]|nr:hypothetical protein [bacterium]
MRRLVWLLVVMMFCAGWSAMAYEIKWSQPPQLNPESPQPHCFWGWDELSIYGGPQIAADDWLCESDRPVIGIRWWGSHIGWEGPNPPANVPVAFHIGIWTDVPTGQPDPFSHPGVMLWEYVVPYNQLMVETFGCDYYPGHLMDTCFMYEFMLPSDKWFYQDPGPTVYWLSISAIYDVFPDMFEWGWKTREHFFNDAAVRIFNPLMPVPGDQYIEGEPIYEPELVPWDLSFELFTTDTVGTATPTPDPTMTPEITATPTSLPDVKWSQPPQFNPSSPYPHCYWGWDEISIYGGPQIAADDWLCEDDRPVTGIRWWGSYLDWEQGEPPSSAPDLFHLAIWTDVPAGLPEPYSHPGILIWETIVPRLEVVEAYSGCDFYPGYTLDTCFFYEYRIPPPEWFYQEPGPTVYWLSVSAIYTVAPPDLNLWGWKTREHYFNDAAIRIFDPLTPGMGSIYMAGLPIEEPPEIPWDLAFELVSDISVPTATPTGPPTGPPTNTPTNPPTVTSGPSQTPLPIPTTSAAGVGILFVVLTVLILFAGIRFKH